MTNPTPSETEPTRTNPWLSALGGFAAVSLLMGLVISLGSRSDSATSDSEAADQLFGGALLSLGGTLLAGWMVAAAICWQLARNAVSRDAST